MRSIHPFPARMAPDAITNVLQGLAPNSLVLDPMCGSGVVLRQALLAGHEAVGIDLDPLAVLMSRVWTRRYNPKTILQYCEGILAEVTRRTSKPKVPWIDECPETTAFIKYWFGPVQEFELRCLSSFLAKNKFIWSKPIGDFFSLALSRTVITKTAGASLATDVSHSRPRKTLTTNNYSVYSGFGTAVRSILRRLEDYPLPKTGKVLAGDARRLSRIADKTIDAVLTSPPYLNAIDYLRGHKFSLIWMGYTIPELRLMRAEAIGAERSAQLMYLPSDYWKTLCKTIPAINRLPKRQYCIFQRYSEDAYRTLTELRRVIRRGGSLTLVLGDSYIQGKYIRNSKLFETLARELGFSIVEERR